MSYIEKNLLKNERIIYFTRMHSVVFLMPVTLLIVTVILSGVAPKLFIGYVPFFNVRLASLIILICLAAAIISGIGSFIRFANSEYAVTDKRIMMKTGWINRNSLEIFIDKIEAIYVDQSILGRVLDYGTLRIVGTGGTQDPFFLIPRPLIFRKIAQEQVDIEEHPGSRKKN